MERMNLRPYQRRAVEWSKCNDGLIVAPAGSGKTWIAAAILEHHLKDGRTAGWLAPTRETCEQGMAAAELAGVADRVEVRCPHDSVDFSKKDVLIVDECFPAWVKIGEKQISEIRPGDFVDSYNHSLNVVEKRKVLDVFKTPAPQKIVTVWTALGPTTCTPGHPFWNGTEYVPAISLTAGDFVATIPRHERGMQGVWKRNRKKRPLFFNEKTGLRILQNCTSRDEEETVSDSVCMVQGANRLLREEAVSQEFGRFQEGTCVLLDSMQGSHGVENEFGNHVGNKQEDGGQDFKVDVIKEGFRGNSDPNFGVAQKDRTQTGGPWRERDWSHIDAANAVKHVQPYHGVSDSNGRKRCSKCPQLLQSGFSGSICEARRGGGWRIARDDKQERGGSKENRDTQFVRVVCVEIHEQGSSSWRKAMRGENHVYNFSVEGNENYFANGILVHNCKHAPASTWSHIIKSCNGLKFGFDATPWHDSNKERNDELKRMFPSIFVITREDVGDALVDATVILKDDSDDNLERRIDANIDRLMSVRSRYMRISKEELNAMCAWESIVDIGIAGNALRNKAAIDFANDNAGKQRLILVPRVTLGEEYERRIPGSLLLHSGVPKKPRREAVQAFRAGDLSCIVATSLADEGLDLPNIEVLVMVSGGRSSQKTTQRMSRALRVSPGKKMATILDFRDRFHPIAMRQAMKRIQTYRSLGCIFGGGNKFVVSR